jgi:hypothetical protein
MLLIFFRADAGDTDKNELKFIMTMVYDAQSFGITLILMIKFMNGLPFLGATHAESAWKIAEKLLHFVRRSRILLRCGSACAIAALLGRFLPRLGPLANASGPFFV